MTSTIWIVRGVPPRMYPTLKSCNSSPATADETQTTAATPSTAMTPLVPETPNETISSAAMIRVDSVRPEIGLLDEPITPTRYPETVAKKKPVTSMTTAAAIPPPSLPERFTYSTAMSTKITAMPAKTVLELM